MNINRIVFLFGNDVFVKVGTHNKRSDKLILKSNCTKAAAQLCEAFGVKPGNQWGGAVHCAIMEVDKMAFVEALGSMAAAIEASQPKQLTEAGTCSECGGTDGKHWGVCSQHFEQMQLN